MYLTSKYQRLYNIFTQQQQLFTKVNLAIWLVRSADSRNDVEFLGVAIEFEMASGPRLHPHNCVISLVETGRAFWSRDHSGWLASRARSSRRNSRPRRQARRKQIRKSFASLFHSRWFLFRKQPASRIIGLRPSSTDRSRRLSTLLRFVCPTGDHVFADFWFTLLKLGHEVWSVRMRYDGERKDACEIRWRDSL